MSNKLYKREIILSSNAEPEKHYLKLQVTTASPTIGIEDYNRDKYPTIVAKVDNPSWEWLAYTFVVSGIFLGGFLAVGGLSGGLGVMVAGIYGVMLIYPLLYPYTISIYCEPSFWLFRLLFWLGYIFTVSIIFLGTFVAVGWVLGGVLGMVFGGVLGGVLIYRLLYESLRGFIKYGDNPIGDNPMFLHDNINPVFAWLYILLSGGFGTSIFSWCLISSLSIFALVATGLALVGMLFYYPIKKRVLIAQYYRRERKQNLIAP